MDSRTIIRQLISCLVYILVQVFFIRHFVLFDGWAVCYIYVGFLLMLPFEIDTVILILIGAFVGLITDIFYDTLGIHTAACVFIMFLRPYIIKMLNPRGGYDDNPIISLSYMGISWYLSYIFILVLIHHLVLFIVEASSFNFMLPAILKAIFSSIFTVLMLMISQFLFYRNEK